jgi:uncharacterized membrane protein
VVIRSSPWAAATASVLLAVTAAHAGTPALDPHIGYWVSFDVPTATYTQGIAINDRGQITGLWQDQNGTSHGFLREADGRIVTFDPPGMGVGGAGAARGTYPTGINNRGDIVGYYSDKTGGQHGFLRSADSQYTVIDDPNANTSPISTAVYAISDTGVIVGGFTDTGDVPVHGFLREADGSFITVDNPGAEGGSTCYGINIEREVVCQALVLRDNFFVGRGFTRYRDGALITFNDAQAGPGGTFVGCNGSCGYASFQILNGGRQVTGYYLDANGVFHGYLRHANGSFTDITVPGTSSGPGTVPASVNSLGTVVGSAYPNELTLGDAFIRFADGTLALFDAPVTGQQGTNALAVNSFNEVTGLWTDANFVGHGFLAVALRW